MTRISPRSLRRIAKGCAAWLRAPQPRSGAALDGADGDRRRARADLDAIRARFGDCS